MHTCVGSIKQKIWNNTEITATRTNSNKSCCSVRIYCRLFGLKVHHLWIHPCSMPGCATYFLFHLFLSVVYSLVGTSTPGRKPVWNHFILTTKQNATATRTRTADVWMWPLLCCKKLVSHTVMCAYMFTFF